MKVLVTGGGGFLGRYIVERLLERGDEVSIFCRGAYPEIEKLGVEVIRGNLKNRKQVINAIKGNKIVFHVASKIDMFGKYKDFYEINVRGTKNVIDGCIQGNVSKLIYTSSASVVFDCEDLEGVDESTPYPEKYLAPYPKTKKLAEQLIMKANGIKGLETTILRPHLIWGPRDPSLAPRLIEIGKEGRLPLIGPGDNKVDLTYVENVADAHILAAESSKAAGQIYFIGQDEPVVPWEFLQELFSRLGIPPITLRLPYKLVYLGGALIEILFKFFGIKNREPLLTRFLASELAKSHYFDISKARKELGYEPKVSLQEGLNEYVKYYKDQEKSNNTAK